MKNPKPVKFCGENCRGCPYLGIGNPPVCNYEGYCDYQLPRDSQKEKYLFDSFHTSFSQVCYYGWMNTGGECHRCWPFSFIENPASF